MNEVIRDILRVIAAAHPEALAEVLGENTNDADYREDGWSHQTRLGCRRHQDIDEALDDLAGGDKYARQVVEQAARWFCFHPDTYPDMVADDPGEAGMARGAYNAMWGSSLVFQGGKGFYPMDYRVRLAEPDRANNRYFDVIDGHAVVYDPSENDAPANFPAEYVESLFSKAGRLREAGESDDTNPGVSPG